MTAEQTPTLTIAEAAARLSVSPKTVRQRIKRGELPAHLVEGPHGPEYRLPAEGLENQGAAEKPVIGVFSSHGNGQATLNGTLETGGKGTLEADSSPLNPQARRAGQATLNGTLEGAAGMTWYPREKDHRAELAERARDLLREQRDQALREVERAREDMDHLRAQLDHRTEELQRHAIAEEQLRVMLMRLEETNRELAQTLVVKALPPAPDTQPEMPKRTRWWSLFRR